MKALLLGRLARLVLVLPQQEPQRPGPQVQPLPVELLPALVRRALLPLGLLERQGPGPLELGQSVHLMPLGPGPLLPRLPHSLRNL